MAQVTFSGSSGTIPNLNQNFTQLYDLRELISTPAYTAATPKISISAAGGISVAAPTSGVGVTVLGGGIAVTGISDFFSLTRVGRVGTQDYLYINGQTAGSGALITCLDTTSSFYAPMTLDFSTLTLRRSGLNVLTTTASGNIAVNAPGAGAVLTTGSDLAIVAGGSARTAICFTSTALFGVFAGSGAPSMSAAKGSLYLRSDGSSTSTRIYVNTDGAGTWTAITTVA